MLKQLKQYKCNYHFWIPERGDLDIWEEFFGITSGTNNERLTKEEWILI